MGDGLRLSLKDADALWYIIHKRVERMDVMKYRVFKSTMMDYYHTLDQEMAVFYEISTGCLTNAYADPIEYGADDEPSIEELDSSEDHIFLFSDESVDGFEMMTDFSDQLKDKHVRLQVLSSLGTEQGSGGFEETIDRLSLSGEWEAYQLETLMQSVLGNVEAVAFEFID